MIFPSRRASVLITGEGGRTSAIGTALLERLCKAGYQFCVLDTRGDYTNFPSAVTFGTLTNPPAVEEVLTALEKPDVQAIVCLAAVPEEDRIEFVSRLLVPLREVRAMTGRPHWILVDEAREKASGTWNKVEKAFDDQVQGVLKRLHVPTADEVTALEARIDALHARLAKLENRAASGTDAPAPGSHQSPDSVP